MLSTVPTSTIAHKSNPKACICMPVNSKNNMEGTKTIEVPSVGTKEASPATTPHNAGLGTPKIQSPTQDRIP